MTSVPLPGAATEQVPFRVEFELEVPAQLFLAQDQWRSLQVMSRLQSPNEPRDALGDGTPDPFASVDRLRELALSVAHRLKSSREEFARECLFANCLMSRCPSERLLERLLALLSSVDDHVTRARSRMDDAPADSPQIMQERSLTAEFVSNQLLEFLFHARRAIEEQLLRPGGPHTEALRETAAAFDRAIEMPLRREAAYRAAHGFVTPTSEDPKVLEQYLDRNSQLKKHFQELLFLGMETTSIESALKNWGTIAGAMTASVFGFVLNKVGLLGQSASLGLAVAAIVGAVVYAVQDRIKDLGKTYVPSKLGKGRAQRVTRLSAPPRRNGGEPKLVSTIEESMYAKLQHRVDPLNPDLGACRPVHVVRYTSRGVSELAPELLGRGITSLKQIFRYDMSWLFARLDDASKAVPVLAADGLRVAKAPRCYRMPVRVKLIVGDHTFDRSATAVMHKGGLERLELDQAAETQMHAAA